MRPDLRVITGDGEIAEDLTPILSDAAALLEVVVKQRNEIARLKRAAAKAAAVDPAADTIGEVLEYWRVQTGHLRAQIPVDGKRWRIVKARLKENERLDDEHVVQRLKRAVDGVVAFKYEGDYGRRYTEPGSGRKPKDDIWHAMRDEERVDRMIELADGDGPMQAYRRFVFDACTQRPDLVRALAVLAAQEPQDGVLARAVVWARGEVEK